MTDELSARLSQPVESVLYIDPYRAVLFDIAQGDVRGVGLVVTGTDVFDAAVFGEGVTVDAVACHLPNAPFAVGIDADGRACQLATDVTIAVNGGDIVHRA